ncbi:hypothetical protein TNCV_819971 [Trichonephila clavipes]|nr:hypothetical protein TNCV_819971 [Trichonephila clavipes]
MQILLPDPPVQIQLPDPRQPSVLLPDPPVQLPPVVETLKMTLTDDSSMDQRFEPRTTKDPPCRATMHVKSVES